MRLFSFYGGAHLSRSIHSDFWRLEYAIWLHAVGRALIGVFVPLLLVRLGFSLPTVIFYYFLFNLLDVPLNFVAERVILKVGARRVIIFATLTSIAYFGILAGMRPGNFGMLMLLALLDAVYDTHYWVAHVYLFLKSSRSDAGAGRQTGILYATRTLAAALGPLIGALILLFGTSRELIGASIFFFVLSLIPLLSLRHTADRPRKDDISFREFFKDPLEKRNYLSTTLASIHGAAEGILWPLFIYSIFHTTESVAYVAIALSLSAAAFSYMTGLIEEHGRTPVIIFGALSGVGVWLFRLFTGNPAFYFPTVAVIGFCMLLVTVPLDGSLYKRAREGASLRAAAYRNAFSMSGYLLVFTILMLAPKTYLTSFVLAAAALFGIALLALRYFLRTRAVATPA